jgi:hypothetical protein
MSERDIIERLGADHAWPCVHGRKCVRCDAARDIAALREQVAKLREANVEKMKQRNAERDRATAAEARVTVLEEFMGILAFGIDNLTADAAKYPQLKMHATQIDTLNLMRHRTLKALDGGEGG